LEHTEKTAGFDLSSAATAPSSKPQTMLSKFSLPRAFVSKTDAGLHLKKQTEAKCSVVVQSNTKMHKDSIPYSFYQLLTITIWLLSVIFCEASTSFY
jgi:hypothetical protein